jgi:hypothetical protein
MFENSPVTPFGSVILLIALIISNATAQTTRNINAGHQLKLGLSLADD